MVAILLSSHKTYKEKVRNRFLPSELIEETLKTAQGVANERHFLRDPTERHVWATSRSVPNKGMTKASALAFSDRKSM